jgi:hypothetical protein
MPSGMLRRPPPPPQRLPPFRLHYPTHAGNMLSSIPPPYEMAFPSPQPKKKTHPVAFAAVMLLTASAVIGSGLWGWRQWTNAKAREHQLAMITNEKIAETHALLSTVHDRFPVGLTEERACEDDRIPEGTRAPLLSFSQLRAGEPISPAEALLRPSFEVTRDTVLEGPVVAVLMTNEATLQPGGAERPRPSEATDVSRAERARLGGSFDGWLVVFDRQATPLCQAHVVTKADGGSFVDLKNQLRGAERAAAMRLSPKLALEL